MNSEYGLAIVSGSSLARRIRLINQSRSPPSSCRDAALFRSLERSRRDRGVALVDPTDAKRRARRNEGSTATSRRRVVDFRAPGVRV
jgi:hypothetical protein